MVNLYSYNQQIETSLSSPQSAFLAMTETTFKVFRGARTVIDFKVRDLNAQVVDLTDKKLVLNVFCYETREFRFYKVLNVVDGIRGKAQAVFDIVDTVDLLPTYYYYSLSAFDQGVPEPFFIDQTVNALSYFELVEGVMPAPVRSVTVDPADYSPTTTTMVGGDTYWVAGPFAGDSNKYRTDGLHTVAVYGDNFSGKFYIEISLNENPLLDDWSAIWLEELSPWKNYDQFTGIDPFTFQANAKWVRFKFQQSPGQEGNIKKVMYRN